MTSTTNIIKAFSFKWTKTKTIKNLAHINIKVIDEYGKIRILRKTFPEWMGICTKDIDKVCKKVFKMFKSCHAKRLGCDTLYRKTFPILQDRITKEDFDYEAHPFYRIYSDKANTYEAGLCFESEMAYYKEGDWLTRVYLEFFEKFKTDRFYYSWYDIDVDEPDLLKSFVRWYEEDLQLPAVKIASFDLETVPWEGDRFPNGFHPQDVIVMISLVVANQHQKVFYLLPRANMKPIPQFMPFNELLFIECVPFTSEIELIDSFLRAIEEPDILILTGYNILSFDLPCLFSRLAFHAFNGCSVAKRCLSKFSSKKIGKHVVTTFRKKVVIDMYHFILGFSAYNLSDFKLDSVAAARLGYRKVNMSPVAIHRWYQARSSLPEDALLENDVERAYHQLVRPQAMKLSLFGTFLTSVLYCFVDSKLVLDLFRKENVLSFLATRSNVCTMDMEQSLYFGNSKYVECVLATYGTTLGFFVDLSKYRNICCDEQERPFTDYAKVRAGSNKYQGALNYGKEMSFHQNVACLDFESLYPSVIMCFNLSPDTLTVCSSETYNTTLSDSIRRRCHATGFRVHKDSDFETAASATTTTTSQDRFALPQNSDDGLVILRITDVEGFIPKVLYTLREKRRRYKDLMRSDRANYNFYYNNQLMFKLLMNSMYGCFGSDDSVLSNISVAMCVTFFAREILLASYHRCQSLGYQVPYCDTDSLFVANCNDARLTEDINNYLGFTGVINLQKESQFKSLIIITKKKYCVRTADSKILTKGFEKKSNQLAIDMVNETLNECFNVLENDLRLPEWHGWCFLQQLLQKAFIESRDPFRYVVNKKVKRLEEYSPKTTAPHVRLMRRNNIQDRSIQFTYTFTDISREGNKNENPLLPEEVDDDALVDFEQLFISQKRNILSLLNVAIFRYDNVRILERECDKLLQRMRWKRVVQAALLCRQNFDGEDLLVCFRKDLKYTLKPVHTRK